MITQTQQEKFQTLMRGTILSLCQNVLEHKTEIKVEVFIGITLDKKQDFHFSVVETLQADAVSGSTEDSAKCNEASSQSCENSSYGENRREASPTHKAGQAKTPSTKHKPAQGSNNTSTASGGPSRYSGSMLERLMVQDSSSSSSSHRVPEYYKSSPREVSPTSSSSAKYKHHDKSREVSSSEPQPSAASLSYSELLRSFGEMSRQDNLSFPPPPPPISQATTCPTLYNSLTSNRSSRHGADAHSSVNQAQVVIPINFAIHSSADGGGVSASRGTPSLPPSYNQNPQYSDSSSPHSKERKHKPDKKIKPPPPDDEDIPPDSTNPHSSENYGIKVKQEVLSDDEPDLPSDYSAGHYHPMVPPSQSRDHQRPRPALAKHSESPGHSNDSSASSSQGILMSLLCEKIPDSAKKNKPKRNKRKLEDTTYHPSPSAQVTRREAPALRDKRVLIGLTDYLPGFKDGDLTQEKPPKLVFTAQDIIAKTRKVVLLNCGAFSTVRMVHRGLQGMKAYEIGDIMLKMTKPQGHPEYVGEYKVVTMNKVRQGRKSVGVFYKCPPDLVTETAMKAYDIMLMDYARFYNQTFRYDRLPQPQYFQAIEEASPFPNTFIHTDRYWREPDGKRYDTGKDTDDSRLFDESGGMSHYNDGVQADADGENDVANPDLNLRIVKVKTEQNDWDCVPSEKEKFLDGSPRPSTAYPDYPTVEPEGPEDLSTVPSAEPSTNWPSNVDSTSHNDEDLTGYMETEYKPDYDSFPPHCDNADEDRSSQRIENVGYADEQDGNPDKRSPDPYDQDFHAQESSSVMSSQPVFPQPLMVEDAIGHHSNESEQQEASEQELSPV